MPPVHIKAHRFIARRKFRLNEMEGDHRSGENRHARQSNRYQPTDGRGRLHFSPRRNMLRQASRVLASLIDVPSIGQSGISTHLAVIDAPPKLPPQSTRYERPASMTRLLRNLLLALATGFILFVFSERIFWSVWRPGDSFADLAMTWLAYSVVAYLFLAVVAWSRADDCWTVFLAGTV